MLTAENFLESLDKITPQWLAGFFDGEGCISSSFDANGVAKLRVEIVQKNKYMITLIMLKFPGNFKEVTDKRNRRNNICHRLHWDGRLTIPFLEYIEPFVIFKHELVVNALKLAKLHQSGNTIIGDEIKEQRASLKEKISSINDFNRSFAS